MTKEDQDKLIEQIHAKEARKRRIQEVAHALLHQCVGEGFSVRNLENVCELAISHAKNGTLSIPQE